MTDDTDNVINVTGRLPIPICTGAGASDCQTFTCRNWTS
jgi:hypothetical protein